MAEEEEQGSPNSNTAAAPAAILEAMHGIKQASGGTAIRVRNRFGQHRDGRAAKHAPAVLFRCLGETVGYLHAQDLELGVECFREIE